MPTFCLRLLLPEERPAELPLALCDSSAEAMLCGGVEVCSRYGSVVLHDRPAGVKAGRATVGVSARVVGRRERWWWKDDSAW
jgi:hypothetical protein